ncbi:hypothetical protein NAEGRDRAFT_78129 [Naegleria gruberi]|uniref:Uncharacterized protein n=1 Tax=Naegleria gruberi TaxID=5762 RepID=D2V1E1_NAEGR|nr:uncharacterized protein NAEGRDRAFT_78129 [Naegleria gruberi]EFC49149.1 hypothetical protein NAEGRDRAFT_78129 [Naegleria gruberi]|eukprot:XP_002681893.1 hypothetical protein NAEGRDRAFT_78129 [Naegleria gruberi strain NEG-M]
MTEQLLTQSPVANRQQNNNTYKVSESDVSSSIRGPFTLDYIEQQKTKELLKYCVALRDFRLRDKYIQPEELQNWEICKCQFMFKEHNMMEVLVSELYRLKGYDRTSNVIGRNSNTSLNALYNEVNQALQDLKIETMKLQPVYEDSKHKHLMEMCNNNEISTSFFSREQTPVELIFMEFSNLAERIVELNQTIIEPIIRNISKASGNY